MKKSVSLLALVAVFSFITFNSSAWSSTPTPDIYALEQDEGDNLASTGDDLNIRSGDPCKKLIEWGPGITLPELKNGRAEHDLTPAEALVLATQENNGNIVNMLVIAQLSQELITVDQTWNKDFEYRLLEAMNYGSQMGVRSNWYGFVPQLVGTSYQFFLEETRALTFQQAFAKFTGKQESWLKFRLLYSQYAWLMNYYLGTNYPIRPSSYGYYHHFKVTTQSRQKVVAVVQKFFQAMNSPLKNRKLFQEPATPSIINYDAVDKFCQ